MRSQRMRIAENTLQRIRLIDTGRAGNCMQRIHSLGTQHCGICRITLVAQLLLSIGHHIFVCKVLRLDGICAQHQFSGINFHRRCGHAMLHDLLVAHFETGVVGATLFH